MARLAKTTERHGSHAYIDAEVIKSSRPMLKNSLWHP
jgi:hypothetical protein